MITKEGTMRTYPYSIGNANNIHKNVMYFTRVVIIFNVLRTFIFAI
jgi:hypothetical protein